MAQKRNPFLTHLSARSANIIWEVAKLKGSRSFPFVLINKWFALGLSAFFLLPSPHLFRDLLCSPGYLQTHTRSVSASWVLKLKACVTTASWVLGLKACVITPGCSFHASYFSIRWKSVPFTRSFWRYFSYIPLNSMLFSNCESDMFQVSPWSTGLKQRPKDLFVLTGLFGFASATLIYSFCIPFFLVSSLCFVSCCSDFLCTFLSAGVEALHSFSYS